MRKGQRYVVSDATRAKLAEAQRRRFQDPGELERMREAVRAGWQSPELRERAKGWMERQWQDPEIRAKRTAVAQQQWLVPGRLEQQRDAMNKRFADPAERDKIRRQVSGSGNPNFGKHHSAETLAKIAESSKKRWSDPEMRSKMVDALRRAAKEGGPSKFRGIPRTPETRAKISAAKTGVPQSSACREARSKAMRRLWCNLEYRERAIRATLKACHSRPTQPEVLLRSLLDDNFPNEWRYVGDGDTIIGGKNPDFVNVNGQKAVIEMFGDYWHSKDVKGIPVDQHVAERVAHFRTYGFDCLVVWERELATPELVVAKVKAMEVKSGESS